MPRERAWIGLGSNLEDPPTQLDRALAALDRLPDTRRVATSSFYRTAPVGPSDQPDFCNAVAGLDTALSPAALLHALQAVEAAAGRVRTRRWGARTLDLDILLYGECRIDRADLIVPHPRLAERAFVLVPLAEVAATARVPGHGDVAALSAAVGSAGVALWEAS